MKFTIKQKIRLGFLEAKSDKTDDEVKELEDLKAKAKEAKQNVDDIIKHFAPDGDEEAEGHSISDEDLAELIGESVKNAMEAEGAQTVDTEKVIGEIHKLAKSADGGVTAEKVEEIVLKHFGGTSIDKDALIKDVQKTIKDAIGAQDSDKLTHGDLVKALDEFAATIKTPSNNEFQGETERDFPFEHRGQNLTVAEKQLANICVAHVSDEVKENMRGNKQHVPTSMNDGITAEQLEYAARKGAAHAKAARHAVLYGGKTLTTGGSGSGAELVPTDLSADLQARMYLESQIAAEFLASELEMPTNPFQFPLRTTRTNFYVGTEAPGSDPTASEPGTSLITLDAKKLIGMSEYSYEADEDAIIAILPFIQENLASGAADAYEGAVINGDTAGTHQDHDINGVTGHHAKLFDGLRKYALAVGALSKDLSTGGISASNIAAMRKSMKRWGLRPKDLMIICGPQGYNDLVTLDETLTFEKVGNQAAARILTGEAGSIYGIRIVVSSQIREDLDANGVYPDGGGTKGSLLMVHRPSWITGSKRGFTVEVDVDKKRQINSVVASFRRCMVPKETPSANIPTVVMGRNFDAA